MGASMVDAAEAGSAEASEVFTHPIFQLAPGEDSGSDTLGRYRYQAEVAARDCLAMLTEDGIEYVVCEWHEDFVVAYVDGSVELVSVKHREQDQGTWSVTELCKNGGLAHLFDRWCACECAANVRLRLSTNAALNPAKDNAAALARMCGPGPELTAGLDAMVRKIACNFLKVRWKQPYANIPDTPPVTKLDDIRLPVGFLEKVKGFLAVLEISCDLPARRFITDVNIQQILIPSVQRLQIADADVEATYRAVIERIERSNRDESDRGQLAAHIADPARVQYNRQLQQRISRRLLSRDILLQEVVHTTARLPTYERGQVPASAPGGARLSRKLRRGQVPSDEAAFAEELRSAWYVTWSGRRSGLAGDTADLANLSLEVLEIVFSCRSHAQSQVIDGSAFGTQMNGLIKERLKVDTLPESPPFKINNFHLRGLAYQLCDECRFFFSAPFDAAEEAS
jgi:hypothetical protein